jgi:spore coat protein U-like protein
MVTRLSAAAATLLVMLCTQPAQARSARTTLIVSATVVQSCSTATAPNTGLASHFSRGSAARKPAVVSVNCSEGTPYTVDWNTASAPYYDTVAVTVSF